MWCPPGSRNIQLWGVEVHSRASWREAAPEDQGCTWGLSCTISEWWVRATATEFILYTGNGKRNLKLKRVCTTPVIPNAVLHNTVTCLQRFCGEGMYSSEDNMLAYLPTSFPQLWILSPCPHYDSRTKLPENMYRLCSSATLRIVLLLCFACSCMFCAQELYLYAGI